MSPGRAEALERLPLGALWVPVASSGPASGAMDKTLGLLLTPLRLTHALHVAVLAGSPLLFAHLRSLHPSSIRTRPTATSQGWPFGCNHGTWGFIVVFHHQITDVHPNHCPPVLPGCIREALPDLLFQAGGQGGLGPLLSTEGSPVETEQEEALKGAAPKQGEVGEGREGRKKENIRRKRREERGGGETEAAGGAEQGGPNVLTRPHPGELSASHGPVLRPTGGTTRKPGHPVSQAPGPGLPTEPLEPRGTAQLS